MIIFITTSITSVIITRRACVGMVMMLMMIMGMMIMTVMGPAGAGDDTHAFCRG